jgi:hypothetical protein
MNSDAVMIFAFRLVSSSTMDSLHCNNLVHGVDVDIAQGEPGGQAFVFAVTVQNMASASLAKVSNMGHL